MDSIASQLDLESDTGNWKALARTFGASRTVCDQLANPPSYDPTGHLFRHLNAARPNMMIKELKTNVEQMGRQDVLKELKEACLKGNLRSLEDMPKAIS